VAGTAQTDAVDLVRRLLAAARARGASDLHLDPFEGGLEVRARVDGILEVLDFVPVGLAPRVLGRLKALAELLAYRADLPQEGRIPAERSGVDAEVRVATYPSLFGERAALRFDARDHRDELADLGLAGDVFAAVAAAVTQPDGVVLLTGPSGSGKTTTLYACLRHLAAERPRRGIVTVEDPIERRVAGVTQTEVNPAAGLTFPRALRSLLRQDPDAILVGEIRDPETAAIALEAGLTGHLVLSTVHAGTAPEVFARLLDMGVEPFVLTTVVRGVLAQRLLRRADGSGRLPVTQWVGMNPALRAAVKERGDGDALAAAADVPSLRHRAEALVARGLVTTEEVRRVLGR